MRVSALVIVMSVLVAFPAVAQMRQRNYGGTFTGSYGNSGTYQGTGTWNRNAGTGAWNNTATLSDGRTATGSGTAVRTAPGVVDLTGSRTGFNGNTRTYSDVRTAVPGGAVVNRTVTGPHGTSTGTTDITRQGGVVNRDTTMVGPHGNTTVRDTTVTRRAR